VLDAILLSLLASSGIYAAASLQELKIMQKTPDSEGGNPGKQQQSEQRTKQQKQQRHAHATPQLKITQ